MNIERFKRCNPDLDPTKYVEVGGGWAHKTAIIGAYASIGADARIGERARIGAYALIGAYASIGADARIGECALIGAYASIGADASIGECARIDEGASIGAYASIGAGASIGADAKVSANNIIYLGRAYKYTAAAYLDESLGLWTVQLGCYMRSVAAWDADFWNNPNEFPNDGSEKSNARLRAYRMLKAAIKASTVTS